MPSSIIYKKISEREREREFMPFYDISLEPKITKLIFSKKKMI